MTRLRSIGCSRGLSPDASVSLILLLSGALLACGAEPPDDTVGVQESAHSHVMTVDQAVGAFCSTSAVEGLSMQILAEANRLVPGAFVDLSASLALDLTPAAYPYMEASAAKAFVSAAAMHGGVARVNSMLRTPAQQYLLYRWYQGHACGIQLAAPPGTSNHETGLAVDLEDYASWRSAMQASGFGWLGWSDPWHFDYWSGTSRSGLMIRAFQSLWNCSHPNDRIAVDGAWGWQTESRMRKAPARGFSTTCGAEAGSPAPAPEVNAALRPIEVYWHREYGSHYQLRALPPAEVDEVAYFANGYEIARTSSAGAYGNFPASYGFNCGGTAGGVCEKRGVAYEVRGYDDGVEVARGNGRFDVTDAPGAYVKQLGERFYEIGLERWGNHIDYLQVVVDGKYTLNDDATQDTVVGVGSTSGGFDVLALRYRFTVAGERSLTIRGLDHAKTPILGETFRFEVQ
jgi:hypothetical protein